MPGDKGSDANGGGGGSDIGPGWCGCVAARGGEGGCDLTLGPVWDMVDVVGTAGSEVVAIVSCLFPAIEDSEVATLSISKLRGFEEEEESLESEVDDELDRVVCCSGCTCGGRTRDEENAEVSGEKGRSLSKLWWSYIVGDWMSGANPIISYEYPPDKEDNCDRGGLA